MKQLRRVFWPLLAVALLFCPLLSFAQQPQPRLKGTITEAARAILSNSRSPLARIAQDLGAVPLDTAVPGITLVFKRSATQEAALEELIAAQQNPISPMYHRWLTPETFAIRFGMANEDIATTQTWLISCGFHIENVARSRDRITFSGTAAQVRAAFGTELHHYQMEGELHFAPASDLTLPVELASVTATILHLSNFRPMPSFKKQTRPRPDYTTLSTQAHYLQPKDIATMYGLNALYQKGFYGSGQGLAIVGQSFVNTSSLSSIQTFQANLTGANSVSAVLVPGSGVEAISPGDEGESELDLEYASGIATNANIFLVYVGSNQNYSVFDALAFAITEDVAPVVSISYSVCEPLLSSSELDQNNALFEQAAAQGQTLVASAGDSGSTACASYATSQGATLAQQQALSVGFPASSPYITAVGGTQMATGTFTAGDNSYWASATNSDTASSLLSYVPEVVWNEGSASKGIIAGGGGTSAYFPRPTWQSGVRGITSGTYRLVPDVALQSSIASPGFLICSSDLALIGPQGQTSSCNSGLRGSNNQYTLAGGTSFAAPIFAAFITILNEAQHSMGEGNINPVLYSLAADSTAYAAAFHDITSGTNACSSGAGNCAAAGQSNYATAIGYDEATGLGSVDFNALATAWPSSSTATLIPTVMLLIPSETMAAAGGVIPVQIFVQSFNVPSTTPAPSGSVSVSVDGAVVDASLALTAGTDSYSWGTATYNFVAPATAGSHLVNVVYSGDATHSPSRTVTSVMVGNVLATGSLSLAVGNLTIANGSTGSTQITVTPSAGYNGRLVWSLSYTGSSTNLTACYTIPSLAVNNTSTTKLMIGIGTACSSTSAAERAVFQPLGQRASANDRFYGNQRSTLATIAYASLLICALLGGRRGRVRLPLLLAVACFTSVSAGLMGCGGGGNKTDISPTPPTAPSTTTNYTFTLRGTDSVNTSITASTTFTLTVN
jgi:hypothetical protein